MVHGLIRFSAAACGSVRAKLARACSSVQADKVRNVPLSGWARSDTPRIPGERRAWRHRRIAYIRKAGARRAVLSSNIELITTASGPAPGCSIRVQGISMTDSFH